MYRPTSNSNCLLQSSVLRLADRTRFPCAPHKKSDESHCRAPVGFQPCPSLPFRVPNETAWFPNYHLRYEPLQCARCPAFVHIVSGVHSAAFLRRSQCFLPPAAHNFVLLPVLSYTQSAASCTGCVQILHHAPILHRADNDSNDTHIPGSPAPAGQAAEPPSRRRRTAPPKPFAPASAFDTAQLFALFVGQTHV